MMCKVTHSCFGHIHSASEPVRLKLWSAEPRTCAAFWVSGRPRSSESQSRLSLQWPSRPVAPARQRLSRAPLSAFDLVKPKAQRRRHRGKCRRHRGHERALGGSVHQGRPFTWQSCYEWRKMSLRECVLHQFDAI